MGRHSKPDLPGDLPLRDARSTGRRRPAPPRPHRRAGEATGYHRSVGKGRRGVAKWIVGTFAAVVLVGIGVIAVFWGNSALNTAADAAASCPDGGKTIHVVTAPGITDQAVRAAEEWNSADRPVHDHCITVQIQRKSSDEVLDELRPAGAADAAPAAWIPESGAWPRQLEQARPERVAATPKPLKATDDDDYPYVVIGGDGVDEVQQRAAQEFRTFLLESRLIK